jgi:hypothetical protein
VSEERGRRKTRRPGETPGAREGPTNPIQLRRPTILLLLLLFISANFRNLAKNKNPDVFEKNGPKSPHYEERKN